MSELLEAEGDSRISYEEPEYSSSQWYFSRDSIDSVSPSRYDGIEAPKEAYLRKSYCTFLQDLGMHLKVPQITIATAIVCCHRFFLRQSHAKNDRYVIATVCMFLAGKVEETPRLLHQVISVAYEIRHRKDPDTVQQIKVKEVYERERELVLLGERLVLSTLGFHLNVHHPYKPLVAAIKKLKVAQNSLSQVAWNFVNDGLRTSLCLQFKAHHVAAGAIFLAAKFLKVKLPLHNTKPWWQEFGVTPRQLEEVSNQMLELYEQHREVPASRASDSSTAARAGAIPPSTPQVMEKRPAGETKARVHVEPSQHCTQPPDQEARLAVSAHFSQEENLDRLKSATEKRRKFKAGGGGGVVVRGSKAELTMEEELLESGMESAYTSGGVVEALSHYHGDYFHGNPHHAAHGGDSFTDLSRGDHRYPHVHDTAFHSPHGVESGSIDYHNQRREWQEREHKRPRYYKHAV